MPRSFSRWTSWRPGHISTTVKIDTDASPMSITILICAPTASGESTYEETISKPPNTSTTRRIFSCRYVRSV